MKIWDPWRGTTQIAGRKKDQKAESKDKTHRPASGLTITVASHSSVELEDLGTTSESPNFTLDGF